MATAAPSLAPEAARQPSQLLCSLADLEATHPAAAAPAAASDPCLRTLQIGASPASMSAVSQAAAAALIRRASGPITGGPAMVPVADLPSRSGGSAAAAAPRKGGAADGTVAEAEPDDGMTEEWFASVAETPSPYSLNLRQHRKVHGYFVEHVARMVFKHRRTHDSDARLRQIIARARCHDMVPQVLARLRVPLLVQLLYEHPNPHVASQARELNKREEWKTALHLMREEAIKQMGITHAQADAIVARMVEEHAVPAAADNADITADLASDVADTGGNTGRRRGGKRGKRSNKHASPPPAADRAAAVPARGAGKRPQTVLVPGRKRLRTLALRDETAQADSAAKEQAAEDAAMDLTTDADVAKVQDPAPVKRGPGRPRKGEKGVKQQRKQKPAESAAVERLRKRPLQDEEEQTLPPVASQEAVPVLQQQAALLSTNAVTPVAEAVKSAVASARKRARRLPHTVHAVVPVHTKGATARETAAAMAAALVGPAPLPSAPQPPPQPPHVPEQPREQLPGGSRLVLLGSGLPARPASAPVAPALQTAAAAAAVSAPAEPPLPQHWCEPRSESAPPSQIGSAAAEERGMQPASVATPDLQDVENSADDAGRGFSRSPSPPAAAAAGPSSSLLLPFPPANLTIGNPSAAAHVPASATQSRSVSPAPGVRIQEGQGSPFRSCPTAAPKPAAPGKLVRQGDRPIPAAAAPVSMSALMPVPVAGSERQDEDMGFTAEAGGAFKEQRGGVSGQQGAAVSQQQIGGSLTEQGMQSSWWQADGSVQIAAGVGRAVVEAEDMQSDSEEDQRAACANSATTASPASVEADATPAAMNSEIAPGPEEADGEQDMLPEPASPQARPDRGDRLWGCWRERADSEPRATKLDGVPISPPQVLLRRAQSLPKGVAMCAPVKAGWLMDSIAEDAANVSSNRQTTINGNAGEPRTGDRAAPDQAQHAATAQEDAAGAAAVASTAAAAQLSAVEAPGPMESDQSPARVQDNHRDAGMSAVEAISHSGPQLLEEGADSFALRSPQPPPPPPRSASGRALPAPITLKPPGPATASYMRKPPGTARGAPRPNRSPISPGRGAFPNRGAFQGRGRIPGRGSDPARPAAHRGGRDFGGRRSPWSRGPPQHWPPQPPPAVPLPVSPIPYWLAGPFQHIVGWGAQVWGPPAAPPARYVGAQPAPPVAQPSGGAGGSST